MRGEGWVDLASVRTVGSLFSAIGEPVQLAAYHLQLQIITTISGIDMLISRIEMTSYLPKWQFARPRCSPLCDWGPKAILGNAG